MCYAASIRILRLVASLPLVLLQLAYQIHTNVPKHTVSYIDLVPRVEQPQFPDFTSNYKKMIDTQASCTASGGTPDGLGCNYPPPPPPPPAPVYVAPTPVSSDYKLLVYNFESGNNPSAINAQSGACGLGQALPCSKMGCNLGDYSCQDTWFTSYMLRNYGTWANAWQHELNYNWW